VSVLEPRLPILDETDSGLDIDALRIVAQGVDAMGNPQRAIMENCASVRATSVLPTSVGPRKRNEPMGGFGFFRPARERRMARARVVTAQSTSGALLACPSRAPGAFLVVVAHVFCHQSLQMPFVQDDYVV
jgi:hypothetical protein